MGNSADSPWLTIIGINEDGLAGLSIASRKALDAAAVVFGGSRHLALADLKDRGRPWPVPFDIAPVLAEKGRSVVVLASGDPFWFGAGSPIVQHLDASEWVAHPAPSTFSLIASRLGWRLEDVACLGLHAAPFERLVPILTPGKRIICLVRDAEAVHLLCSWLQKHGWGETAITALSAVGGPNERTVYVTATSGFPTTITAPVAVALEPIGGRGLGRASGLADDLFAHDGQITKRPIRALALSALAPRPGEHLWDIGAGSGSISVEWALTGGSATAIEQNPARAENILTNVERFGLAHRIAIVATAAPIGLKNLPRPDAVFFGGGLNNDSFEALWSLIPTGARLVAHAVSLETQALVSELHGRLGGDLDRFEISHAQPLGRMRSWQPTRPIVQWTCVR